MISAEQKATSKVKAARLNKSPMNGVCHRLTAAKQAAAAAALGTVALQGRSFPGWDLHSPLGILSDCSAPDEDCKCLLRWHYRVFHEMNALAMTHPLAMPSAMPRDTPHCCDHVRPGNV
mmetsp:Transcript_61431/g.143753  ORF Transcript_61431/g.143753 Transcript_61431/m.143753 type:complete len:119 (-) Transcript_61431:302-658(-)